MVSSSSAGSAGSVRNSRAPARMAFRIRPLSAVGSRAGRSTGVGVREFLDQLDGLVGVVVEDDDRDVGGDFVRAARGSFVAGEDFGEPDRLRSLPAAVASAVLDSSSGSTRTIRITSFMVFDSG